MMCTGEQALGSERQSLAKLMAMVFREDNEGHESIDQSTDKPS